MHALAALGLALIAATGIAEAFQQPASTAWRLDARHVTEHGVPEDFIFASDYTWLNSE